MASRGLPLAAWSEQDVLALLIEEGLLADVALGLVNGSQLAALDRAACERAVEARLTGAPRQRAADRLFAAIKRVRNGTDPRQPIHKRPAAALDVAAASSHAKQVPPAGQQLHDDNQYYRLLDDGDALVPVLASSPRDSDSDQVDLTKHGFPPLCALPGRLSAVVMLLVLVGSVLACTVFRDKLADMVDVPADEFALKYIRYASIPVLMVPFTYGHIWMALWMTFYPIHFAGCWQIPGTNIGFPIGWQGIVPFKCVEMAKMAVRMLTEKLLRVEEVFSRLDTAEFARLLEPEIAKRMTSVLDRVAREESPRLWGMLPGPLKEQVFKEAARTSPQVVDAMTKEFQDRIDECFDLEALVVEMMTSDMELSNNMFIQCADRELAFIRNSGAWMGGIFGLGQMIVSIYYSQWWILPVVGLVAGAITNWIALFAIFNPINPIPLCGGRVILQGLFLTRQNKVSALYGHIVKRQILTAANLCDALMNGPRSAKTHEIAKKHIRAAFEQSIAPLRSGPLSITVSASLQESLTRMGDRIAQEMAAEMHAIMRNGEAYMDQVFDLETTLRERMRALPPSDFERLLHPIFEQDEFKLVICGGVLGAVFGLAQARLVGF